MGRVENGRRTNLPGGANAEMAQFQTIDDLKPAGKRVIVRADLNVPIRDGRVTDATRLERLAPTLRELASAGASRCYGR